MKNRLLSILLAFALLINFSGVHALVAELSFAMSDTSSSPSHSASDKLSVSSFTKLNNSVAHSGCAMHTHSEQSPDHPCDHSAKKSHVCGSLDCDCGCHMSALTFAIIDIAGVSHVAKLAMFQPQRSPLPPVKMSLRPPILV